MCGIQIYSTPGLGLDHLNEVEKKSHQEVRLGNKKFVYTSVDTNDKAFQNFIQKTFPPMPVEPSSTTKKQNSVSTTQRNVVQRHTVQHAEPEKKQSPKTGENTKKVCSSKPGKPAKTAAKPETKAEETKSKELKTTLLTKLKNVWLVKSVMNRLAEILQGYLNPPYSKKTGHGPLHREKTDSSPLHTKKPDCSPLHTKKPDYSRCPNSSKMRFYHTPYLIG